MATESRVLRFNEYPEEVEEMLDSQDWDEPLNRLRMGVVLTFATTVPYHGGAHRFIVDELDTGHEISLQHPGQLNNGFDFEVRVEGWKRNGIPRPSHDEIYSEFYHKKEHSSREAFNALCRAAFDIYEGFSADEVIDQYGDEFEFTEGRVAEAVLRPLPWLFIEQDIRYWHGDGRDRTVGFIESLYNDDATKEDIEDFQRLNEINQTDLAIRNLKG